MLVVGIYEVVHIEANPKKKNPDVFTVPELYDSML